MTKSFYFQHVKSKGYAINRITFSCTLNHQPASKHFISQISQILLKIISTFRARVVSNVYKLMIKLLKIILQL